ncbi:MAG: oxidoreductase [Chloroflexota bacterium]
MNQSYFQLAGGTEGMQCLAAAFYRHVFADPVMIPLFRNPNDDHVGRMALWLGEFFGGPAEHTYQRGGFSTVASVHHTLNIQDVQREHWIEHMLAACDEVNMPAEVMEYFVPHIHFGAQATQRFSRW